MTTQHTQGEWYANQERTDSHGWQVKIKHPTIAYQYSVIAPELTEANARLIAAAPKLLEALERLVKATDVTESCDWWESPALKEATVAIAAAKVE